MSDRESYDQLVRDAIKRIDDTLLRLFEQLEKSVNERRQQIEQMRKDVGTAQEHCRSSCLARLMQVEEAQVKLRDDYTGIKWFAAKIAAIVGIAVGAVWPWVKAKMVTVFGGHQ